MNPVLDPAQSVCCPSVVHDAAGFGGHGDSHCYKMWYTAKIGSNHAVGYAVIPLPRAPVDGEWAPTNALQLQTPLISLGSTIFIAASFARARRHGKRQDQTSHFFLHNTRAGPFSFNSAHQEARWPRTRLPPWTLLQCTRAEPCSRKQKPFCNHSAKWKLAKQGHEEHFLEVHWHLLRSRVTDIEDISIKFKY